MRPELDQLETRDCPGLAYHLEPFYGTEILVGEYPIAPEGMAVFAAQDALNVVSVYAPYHPTPLMPVPPASFNLEIAATLDDYWFVDKGTFLAVQHELYTFETSDPFWVSWLAGVQANVAAANAKMFAAQDAYWASQPPVPVQPIGNPIQEPLGDNVIVSALLALEEDR